MIIYLTFFWVASAKIINLATLSFKENQCAVFYLHNKNMQNLRQGKRVIWFNRGDGQKA